jgi:small-conductance mechanosensitive channel
MEPLIRFLRLAPGDLLFGNPLYDWGAALSLGLATFLSLVLVRRLIVQRARRVSAEALPGGLRLILVLVQRTRFTPLLALSLIVGSKYLEFGARTERITTGVIFAAIALQGGLWASAAVGFWLDEQARRSGNASSRTMVTIVEFVAKVVIWSIVLLLALDNMGVQVKALLTGLGVGGIAVALAVQNVLGDLLASLSIALDRPFAIGDALTLDTGYSGTVEAIGIKSTRLRSITGEQIVFANSELVKARIRNYGRISERRLVFRIVIEHGTKASDLARVPGLIRDAIAAQPAAQFERAHLMNFSTSGAEYEAAFLVGNADYLPFLEVQQAINLALAAALEANGIAFASMTPVPAAWRRGLLAGSALPA